MLVILVLIIMVVLERISTYLILDLERSIGEVLAIELSSEKTLEVREVIIDVIEKCKEVLERDNNRYISYSAEVTDLYQRTGDIRKKVITKLGG